MFTLTSKRSSSARPESSAQLTLSALISAVLIRATPIRATPIRAMLIISSVFGLSCVEAPYYFYAERITGETFEPIDDAVGIHPSQSVLEDPANPFRRFGVGAETKWEIESGGDPVAGFYAWATILAVQPTGEHQYYAALNLRAIYERGRAAEQDLELTRELALDAFQSVLDHFPESVTFDASGRVPYGLATLALRQIIDMDESPSGGWSLVSTPNGDVVAIQTLDVPPPLEDEEEEE